MLGQGRVMQRWPPSSGFSTGRCSLSKISDTTPKKGFPACPGFMAWAPGRVVIMMPPVSVCHQVSTM